MSTQHLLRALLFSSLGLVAMNLLRPVDVHAQSCTPDPLGGEVCLPDDTPPNDPPPAEDPPKEENPPKKDNPPKNENPPKEPGDNKNNS